ncbi:MAG: hypothetical protein VKI81_08385 [Synechococcaceae cyanobacterium]|nr:hypothetical protein [Synechococcaceae cyanobacterium]
MTRRRRVLPRPRRRLRTPGWPLVAALLLAPVGVAAGLADPVDASSPRETIALECRLGDGPWRRCRMQVREVGAHWFLLIGEQRLEFRHDGTGAVRMQTDRGGWRSVRSRWAEDTSLCWDGVCARGDIPLD